MVKIAESSQIHIYILLLSLFFSLSCFYLTVTAYHTKQNYLHDPSYAFCVVLDDILIPATLSHLVISLSTIFTYASVQEKLKSIPFIAILLLIYAFYEITQAYSQLERYPQTITCLDDFETPLIKRTLQGAFLTECILVIQNLIVLIK